MMKADKNPNHKRLRRPCIKCDKMFVPSSKYQRMCIGCLPQVHKIRLK